ncbi:glycosyltransferase [Modicisalibacter tunisiensis]|uniref:glycosyltransferase n=1 Tax=Modicisalibacter tunisiensis TaxID=390637 RepID=UPI001CCEC8F6|nr:glycosyltransferase [Modicisalibacter tunisiensis]MBZ9539958.1 glycosyltransferase [Modicisalibacter tunisiensis]
MAATFNRLHRELQTRLAEGDSDSALDIARDSLGDPRTRDDALLWMGLLAARAPAPETVDIGLAALATLVLKNEDVSALRLLERLAMTRSQRAAEGEAWQALASASAAEAYRSEPTRPDLLAAHAAYLADAASPAPLRQLLTRHAPQLSAPDELRRLAPLFQRAFGWPFGAIRQAGERLQGWCLIAPDTPTPTLTLQAGQRRIAFTAPQRQPLTLEGDERVDCLRFSLALQGQAESLAVSLADAQGQPRHLAGGPLSLQDTRPPHRRADASLPAEDAEPRRRAVTVLVPVYRGLEVTRRCLDSVLAHRAANRAFQRLVVIDDASPEPEVAALLDAYAARGDIELHRQPLNRGFIGTVNHGLGLHTDDDVVLLNSDTRVHGDWLDRLQRTAYRHARTASVTPLSNNGELLSYLAPCDPAPAPDDDALARLDRAVRRANGNDATRDARIPTGCGFCLYLRRDALDTLGGLDPTLIRGYGEESDWCYRAAAQGWHHRGALDVVVAHEGGVSFGAEKRLRVMQNLGVLEARYPQAERAFTTALQRDRLHPGRQRLWRHWLRTQPMAALRDLDAPGTLPLWPSLAHAERALDAADTQGQRYIALALSRRRQRLTLTGNAPHRWRLDYALPNDSALLGDDLHALGMTAIDARDDSVPNWLERWLPAWCPPRPRSFIEPPALAAAITGIAAETPRLFAVAGTSASLTRPRFLNWLQAQASEPRGARLLPLRRVAWTDSAWRSGHLFPMPLAESRYRERVDLLRHYLPLAGVVLLDTTPLTLADARWLDTAERPLPWWLPDDLADTLPADAQVAADGGSRPIHRLALAHHEAPRRHGHPATTPESHHDGIV